MAYRLSTSEHRDRWHRYQTIAGRVAGLMLLWVMVGAVFLLADWQVPPQHLPWKPLNLSDPVGVATRGKVSRAEGAACRAVLKQGGVFWQEVPDRTEGAFCSLTDAVTLGGGGARLRPAGAPMTCNEALAFSLWERQVVQPAAFAVLGSGVVGIEHFGTYACRRQYGAKDGPVSEHATGAAIDVAAFDLADGRVISVARDWADPGPAGKFLHQVRDGACGVFAVTLSPDYNAEHHDHLHLDMGHGPFCH